MASIDSCEYIWEAGVGFAHSPQHNLIHDHHRAEILKLLLTCFSETMYLPPLGMVCLFTIFTVFTIFAVFTIFTVFTALELTVFTVLTVFTAFTLFTVITVFIVLIVLIV